MIGEITINVYVIYKSREQETVSSRQYVYVNEDRQGNIKTNQSMRTLYVI